jgi:hypothetical protein
MLRATENFATTPAPPAVVTTAAGTEDRFLSPIALQRWESDGGALPAWPVKRTLP